MPVASDDPDLLWLRDHAEAGMILCRQAGPDSSPTGVGEDGRTRAVAGGDIIPVHATFPARHRRMDAGIGQGQTRTGFDILAETPSPGGRDSRVEHLRRGSGHGDARAAGAGKIAEAAGRIWATTEPGCNPTGFAAIVP